MEKPPRKKRRAVQPQYYRVLGKYIQCVCEVESGHHSMEVQMLKLHELVS